MEYTFLILFVGIAIIQTKFCATIAQAPLPERWDGFPKLQERENRPPSTSQSEDDAFDLNAREESPTNSDSESLIQLLSALPPSQIQRAQQLLAGLLSSDGSFPDNSRNDERNTKNDYENVLTNAENVPKRKGNGRRQRKINRRNRKRGNCRRGGPGGDMGYGSRRGEGYGSGMGYGNGMGYGSGTGYGSGGNGFGFGSGSGGGGDGYGTGSGTGIGGRIGGGREGNYGAGAGAGAGTDGNGFGGGYGTGIGEGTGGGRNGYGVEPNNNYGNSDEFDGNTRGGRYPGGKGGRNNGFGSKNERNPYDSMFPNISGTQGAMLGGGSEISGVKVNSFAKPGGNGYPTRMAGRRNAF